MAPDKIKICLFLTPAAATELRVRAAKSGAPGVSAVITRWLEETEERHEQAD